MFEHIKELQFPDGDLSLQKKMISFLSQASCKSPAFICFYLYIPTTQMTLVLVGKGFVLRGWPPKIEVIWALGNI